jgi:hypothetical protein
MLCRHILGRARLTFPTLRCQQLKARLTHKRLCALACGCVRGAQLQRHNSGRRCARSAFASFTRPLPPPQARKSAGAPWLAAAPQRAAAAARPPPPRAAQSLARAQKNRPAAAGHLTVTSLNKLLDDAFAEASVAADKDGGAEAAATASAVAGSPLQVGARPGVAWGLRGGGRRGVGWCWAAAGRGRVYGAF